MKNFEEIFDNVLEGMMNDEVTRSKRMEIRETLLAKVIFGLIVNKVRYLDKCDKNCFKEGFKDKQ